jgi:hypothetical protein
MDEFIEIIKTSKTIANYENSEYNVKRPLERRNTLQKRKTINNSKYLNVYSNDFNFNENSSTLEKANEIENSFTSAVKINFKILKEWNWN